jgi:hypothetical protein
MGFERFARNESILCHAQAPCRVNDLGSFTAIAYEGWVPAAHAHTLLDARRVPPDSPVRPGTATPARA